jgi:Flp pilus assembly protein TadD
MSRRLRLPLLLLAAFAVKLAVLLAFDGHPLLQPDATLDSGVYVRLAVDVATGDIFLGKEPFFVSPLYVYFLAPILAVSRGSLFAPKLVQILLGTAAVALVVLAARRFFDERAALLSGVLFALTGIVTFHEVVLLQAALDPFLTALSLFLLARALADRRVSSKVKETGAPADRWAGWLAAGVAFGLLSLNRPNTLLCTVAVAMALAVWPLVSRRRGGSQSSPPSERTSLRTMRPAPMFVLGAALAIAPVTLRNLAVSGEPVLISSHGGLNFLIGNGPGAQGTYRLLDGITPAIAGQAADARKVAEAAVGRPLSVREVSAHFTRLAFSWIREHPRDAARLFFRKLALVFNAAEVPLNFSYDWYAREEMSALRFLVVGAWLLVPLGLLGLGWRFAMAPRAPFAVWATFVPVYAFSVALFFVSSRYRLPLFVPLVIGAGGALVFAGEAVAARRWKPLAGAAAALLPLALLSGWNFRIDDGRTNEEAEMVLVEIETGKFDEAKRRLSGLLPRHPEKGVLLFRTGQAWQAAGRLPEAVGSYRGALEVDAGQPVILLKLGEALLSSGDERAAAGALSAISPGALDPKAVSGLETQAVELLKEGKSAAAVTALEQVVRLDATSAVARQNLAALYAGTGRFAEASRLAEEALRLRPDYPQAKALLDALARQNPRK